MGLKMGKKVFIAGGGTGGHFYPALAVAQYLKNKGYDIFYFGTDRGIEAQKDFIDNKYLFNIEGVRGKSLLKKASSSYKLMKTALKIRDFIKKEKPEFAICFGGYTSIPLGLASKISGIPLYIHEQNSIPSYSNILLSKFAKKVFVTFDFSKRYFPKEKVIRTGLPIRESLKQRLNLTKEKAREMLGIPVDKKVVLIFGGSQGAKKLNAKAIELAEENPDTIFINIQGKNPIHSNLKNLITYSYYEDMGILYKASDFVISRAGSGTVNELMAFGKYSIFVPYPYAASNHQFYNVKWLEEKGLSKVIEEKDINIINSLIKDILKMDFGLLKSQIKKFAILDAEKRIYEEIVS